MQWKQPMFMGMGSQLLPTELHEITLKETAASGLDAPAGWQKGGEGHTRDPAPRLPLAGQATSHRQICSHPGQRAFQPTTLHSVGSTEWQQLCRANPSRPHRQTTAARGHRGPAELPGLRGDLAHAAVSTAHQILGKEDVAFQTCFSFLQISSFSCPHRKGQYKN